MTATTSYNQNSIEENLAVPQDMILEILNVIVKENLKHQATQVVENRSLLYLSVFINEFDERHLKIIQNLKWMLSEYNDLRWSECEKLNWRES